MTFENGNTLYKVREMAQGTYKGYYHLLEELTLLSDNIILLICDDSTNDT